MYHKDKTNIFGSTVYFENSIFNILCVFYEDRILDLTVLITVSLEFKRKKNVSKSGTGTKLLV